MTTAYAPPADRPALEVSPLTTTNTTPDDPGTELDLILDAGPHPAASGKSVEPSVEVTLQYPQLATFVQDFLAHNYARQVSDISEVAWCPKWFHHGEAVLRLTAMWGAYEQLYRQGPIGLSSWYRDHADHHMLVLLDPKGPFKYCSARNGHKSMLDPLPVDHTDLPEELQ